VRHEDVLLKYQKGRPVGWGRTGLGLASVSRSPR
jgi:hypothetical protein